MACGVRTPMIVMASLPNAPVARDGLACRVPRFLDALDRTVFAHRNSPYRALLEHAGYDAARVRALVEQDGIEPALERLAAAGVYVTAEEYRGERELRRRGLTLRLTERAFANPDASGSDDPGDWSLTLEAYGLDRAPVSVWLPSPDATGRAAVVALATLRGRAPRWFTEQPGPTTPAGGGLRALVMRLTGRSNGHGNGSAAAHVAPDDASSVLDWIRGERGHAVGIVTTAARALALATAAQAAKRRLDGVTLMTSGAPLPPATLRAVQGLGGRAFSSCAMAGCGVVIDGCVRPVAADDGHVRMDRVALVGRRRPIDETGTEGTALLLTTLRANAAQVLVNTETGEAGTIRDRACGCLLGELGFTRHVQRRRRVTVADARESDVASDSETERTPLAA